MVMENITPKIFTVILIAIHFQCNCSMQFTKCSCDVHNKNIFKNVSCYAKAVNRSTTLLNFKGFAVKELNVLMFTVQMYKKNLVEYRPYLVRFTENFCEFKSKNRGGVYMRIITSMFLPYSNLNHKCPFIGYLHLTNFPLDQKKLPQTEAGDFRIDALLFGEHGDLVTLKIYVTGKE